MKFGLEEIQPVLWFWGSREEDIPLAVMRALPCIACVLIVIAGVVLANSSKGERYREVGRGLLRAFPVQIMLSVLASLGYALFESYGISRGFIFLLFAICGIVPIVLTIYFIASVHRNQNKKCDYKE